MQYLELKVKTATAQKMVKGIVLDYERELPYRQLIKDVLKHPPAEGFGFDEFDARLRIKKVLDECTESSLALEDGDANKLKMCVKQMKWSWFAEAFKEFMDDVLAMKPVEKVESSKRRKKLRRPEPEAAEALPEAAPKEG